MSLAIERNEIVHIQPASVADGLGSPFAGELTLAMAKRYLDGIALIDDATILAGVRFALERMKQLVEPAGAAALAAVLFGHIPINDGERVCVVFSGGNVEVDRLGELLAGAAPLEVPPVVPQRGGRL
jgi:threonine dehydratase